MKPEPLALEYAAPSGKQKLPTPPAKKEGPGIEVFFDGVVRRDSMMWAGKWLPALKADEGFYRISGVKGSGKSHLTKLFILDALREVESNPHATLVAYDPKREFYAWLQSLELKVPLSYFCPSDTRSVALDFTNDYGTTQDSRTIANAFYPQDPGERQRFWGDSLRTIYAGVFDAIKRKLGYVDLRLMCLVLEDEELTRRVLGHDPYLIQARKLVTKEGGGVGETVSNIAMTIHSRIAEMKVIAAHLDHAQREVGFFSLRDFVKEPGRGVLVVSKDSDYGDTQDPMNGVLMLRLTQLLDKEQQHPKRKVFVVLDEFPTLAGDRPCPGITDMFLRLRSRGVSVLITYQAHTTLRRIYGDTATENLGQCTNVIYLRQADAESAEYASKDLGIERGWEKKTNVSWGGEYANISQNNHWYERPIYSATELLNHIKTASTKHGVEGRAKSAEGGEKPWRFVIPPETIDETPRRRPDVPEYIERDESTQRLKDLAEEERSALTRKEPRLSKEPTKEEAIEAAWLDSLKRKDG